MHLGNVLRQFPFDGGFELTELAMELGDVGRPEMLLQVVLRPAHEVALVAAEPDTL